MFWRATFFTLICGGFWAAYPCSVQQATAAGPRAAQTPQYLPAETYSTLTVRPAELFALPAFRPWFDFVRQVSQKEAEREQQEFLNNSRGATRRFVFPGGDHSKLLDLESYTLQMSSRTAPSGDLLKPSESRVFRYKNAAASGKALAYAKMDFAPLDVPGFDKQILTSDSRPTWGQQKPPVPFVPIAVPGPDEEPSKAYQDRREQERRDREPIPEADRWKYNNSVWPADERTILYAQHGETLLKLLDAKSTPAWAADYAKVAGYPLSAAVDLKQVRINAKNFITINYLASLSLETQQAVKTVIEHADLGLVAIDTADGLKLFARVNCADEAAAKRTAAALELLRGSPRGLIGPFLSDINRLLPGSSEALGAEFQKALASLTITPQGSIVSLQLKLPAEALAEIFKKTLTATQQTQENIAGIQQMGLAMRGYLSAKKSYPRTIVTQSNQAVSWRVQMLPFLGEDKLYKEYNQAEPWDSETNQKVLAQMPNHFRAPGADPKSTMTSYILPVHPKALCREVPAKFGFREHGVSDGTRNTIAILETETQIPWTKPEDFVIADMQPLPALGCKDLPMLRVIMADGSIRAIRKSVTLEQLLPWLTTDSGEQLPSLDGD